VLTAVLTAVGGVVTSHGNHSPAPLIQRVSEGSCMWMVIRCSVFSGRQATVELVTCRRCEAGTSTSFAAVVLYAFWFVMVDVLTAHGNLLCHNKLA